MSQREVINEVKQIKHSLQQRFDPELLVKLYKLIDMLKMPKPEEEFREFIQRPIPPRVPAEDPECDFEGVV